MQFDHILVRFGEMSTKGKNRSKFVDRLKRNIRGVMKDYPSLKLLSNRDRIFIQLNGEPHMEVSDLLAGIFGIHSFSLAVKCDSDPDVIKQTALEAIQSVYSSGDTFKVSARRSDKTFPVPADQLNGQVGGFVLSNTDGLTVNVRKPDHELKIEVREDSTYIMFQNRFGPGGLPAGISGKAMLMLSGGLDSPAAGYLMMKKGVELEGVHFFSPPYTSERAKQKVLDLSERLYTFGGISKLHIVPFTAIQEQIQQQVPENYTMTSTRRMMLRITDRLREKNNGLAIVTGESVGQVASQTLESMLAINAVTSSPVIRPLAAFDKPEIIDLAKKISTHDISIRPYEDCCTIFTPAAPKTRPKLEKADRYESFVDFESLIAEAVANTETIVLGDTAADSRMDDLL
ncbi:tRNA 4-thiouridine(8) synthase ThiI [Bacillus mangrovi]|uniref:Probable tRNA sulfurtransferase n=1 Tax=Metabacillus mangrovi TaxID=1491830 RepID=A0A7X2V469_9BACI|nr:tRNA uracil 4-sulfurtransferase ThiI [Metabacillus mangrovi]MTH52829.1 tRNA 4-thiouridine(8) synthase ThiI [Metabacillus mangrovi]